MEELTYRVSGMSCAHCEAAIAREVEQVAGVRSVEVDLDAETVVVRGDGIGDEAVRSAIVEAGYELVT
jgi:copper chaperone CopZ